MMLDKVKDFVSSNVNVLCKFKLNGSRNQIEEFDGMIVNVYNSIFLVKSNNDNLVRSFSYADVLIGNLEIKF